MSWRKLWFRIGWTDHLEQRIMKRITRLFTALWAVVWLAGCGLPSDSAGPSSPDPTPNHLLRPITNLLGHTLQGLQGTLMSCQSLPAQQVERVIGPAGGTIQIGPHRLSIPSNALSAPTVISAELPSDPVSSVRFGPAGLQFAQPATLTLSYAHCNGLGLLLPKRIAYTTDLLAIITYLLSTDDPLARKVSAPLDHFSRYAVAW